MVKGLATVRKEWRMAINDDDDVEDDDDDDFLDVDDVDWDLKRMDVVRSLQSSYYKSSPDSSAPSLDEDGLIMRDLPLWRVQWTELPGRSNLLNVHDATYTNMFEIILNGPKPWYVGHLYLPDGSRNLVAPKEYCYELKTWRDEVRDEQRPEKRRRSAVVGTLMRINDFRRMVDGRLLILVQGMERFVVEEIVQPVPYSKAHVRIVPDYDNDNNNNNGKPTTTNINYLDSPASSFCYHDYEYETVPMLSLPKRDYLESTDITGDAVTKVLPFVPYANDYHVQEPLLVSTPDDDDKERSAAMTRKEMIDGFILREPPIHPEVVKASTKHLNLDELEERLWVALEDLCTKTHFRLPPEVLSLLPPDCSGWSGPKPPSFLSPNYPTWRRQRRLSFAASAFLESTELGAGMRQIWLETPSTRSRLR